MKHVIIGGGAAGITAAQTIRTLRPQDEIVLLSQDKHIHSRCMLHKYISGERNETTLNFVPEDFFESNRIEWRRGVEVTGVDTSEKTVYCADDKISYDKLLIATGAVSASVPVAALRTAKNVFGLRSLPDAAAIREAALNAQRIVIIGAGLVGLDAAYALLELQKEVTIVDMGSHIMSLNLDGPSATAYQSRFEDAGCTFHLGRKVVDAVTDGNGNVTQVMLDDGSALFCDFVIAAAGVRPALEFLTGSGIAGDRAVTVDRHMTTSCPDVYAAGDITGLSGIWPNAMRQGEVAAHNMCGNALTYDDAFAAKNTANFFGLVTLSLGALTPTADDRVEIREDMRGYRRIILREGRVMGVILQGDISNSGFWQYLIKNGIRIDTVKKPIWKLSYADFCALDEAGEYLYAANG
jgi:NAD(P)H-nitrite reductase large subunit